MRNVLLFLRDSIVPADASAPNVSLMPEPAGRGTFSILSGCLSTIFIAVWTAYHPDIPATLPRWRTSLDSLIETAGIILLLLFSPELLLIMAACERDEAQYIYQCVRNILNKQKDVGFPLTFKPIVLTHYDTPQTGEIEWTMTHAFFVQMGGFAFREEETDDTGEITVISGQQFINNFAHIKSTISWPSKEDILALSQKSKVAKFFSLEQCVSFIVMFVARLVQGLPTSILEFSTFAYATCAILAYALWWSKPGTIQASPILLDSTLTFLPKPKREESQGVIPTLYSKLERMTSTSRTIITALVPVLFGSIHIPPAVARASFPTATEWWIWQFSLAVLMVLSLFILNLDCFNPQVWTEKFKSRDPLTIKDVVLFWFVFLTTIICALCRFYMVVAAFRQLFYLSPDAFKVPDWSNYIPRFS